MVRCLIHFLNYSDLHVVCLHLLELICFWLFLLEGISLYVYEITIVIYTVNWIILFCLDIYIYIYILFCFNLNYCSRYGCCWLTRSAFFVGLCNNNNRISSSLLNSLLVWMCRFFLFIWIIVAGMFWLFIQKWFLCMDV